MQGAPYGRAFVLCIEPAKVSLHPVGLQSLAQISRLGTVRVAYCRLVVVVKIQRLGIPLALGAAWPLCPFYRFAMGFALLGELLGFERETYNARNRGFGASLALPLALSQVWPASHL